MTNRISSTAPVPALIQRARDEGDLSAQSFDAIMLAADIGAQIQAGLGVAPDDVPAAEVTLVTMMPDDSGSIAMANNESAVRAGHNEVLDSLEKCTQADGILVHTRYLNGHVLYPYRPLAASPRMTAKNYRAVHGTPLYDQTVVLLGTVLAKSKELEASGIPVRTVTLIVSDGADVHSSQQTAASVRSLVEDMRRSENHVVAAMGIDDGQTDFRRVFREMGIPNEWILTLRSSATEIRAAFRLFSQSAIRVSQSAAFSASAFGGFGG
ncbi:MAG TPA: hypothetical protein VKA84_06580 [Gemmatimonadaceae bacterium]|nr:hypothetical protein [Gemmatimonadaceae bacterium]